MRIITLFLAPLLVSSAGRNELFDKGNEDLALCESNENENEIHYGALRGLQEVRYRPFPGPKLGFAKGSDKVSLKSC